MIRGAVGTATLWAIAWATAALPIFVIIFRDMPAAQRLSVSAAIAGRWGLAGAATALTFAFLVGAFERTGNLEEFPWHRAVLWGTCAGAGYSLISVTRTLFEFDAPIVIVTLSLLLGALLGAASAGITLRIARRAIATSNAEKHVGFVSPIL